MVDYSKWEQLEDSDEEAGKRRNKERDEACQRVATLQDDMQLWLRRQIHKVDDQSKCRKLTKDERKVLAKFVMVCSVETGQSDLEKPCQMLDIARDNRWLEEDPGTQEVLCQIQAANVSRTSQEDGHDAEMRDMIVNGLNALAAAKKCGGLRETYAAVCNPTTDKHCDMKKKWQKMEYATNAVLDSMFPALEDPEDGYADECTRREVCVFVLLIVTLLGLTVGATFLVLGVPRGFKHMTGRVQLSEWAKDFQMGAPVRHEPPGGDAYYYAYYYHEVALDSAEESSEL